MHRVLRPGGIATISTEFRIEGPPPGALGLTMFDRAGAAGRRWSTGIGWEPLSDLEAGVSPATLAAAVPLADALQPPPDNPVEAPSTAHVALRHEGWLFTSVHLALRKTGD